MAQEPLASKLGEGGGVVELDETYVGGELKNNFHKNRTKKAGQKIAVMTLIERGGRVRSVKVGDAKKTTLQNVARPHVDRSAHIVTDALASYKGIGDYFKSHDTVDH